MHFCTIYSILSYITQKKGDLEEEEEKVLKENKKVFGCDICQDICPHNKNIPITSIERFKQDTILKLDAEEINDISNKGGTDEAGTAGDEDIHSLWKNNPQIRNSFYN